MFLKRALLIVRLMSLLREFPKGLRCLGRIWPVLPACLQRGHTWRQVGCGGLRLCLLGIHPFGNGHGVHPHGLHEHRKGLTTHVDHLRATHRVWGGLQQATGVDLSRLTNLEGNAVHRNGRVDQLAVAVAHVQT